MSRRAERVNHVIRDRICEVLQREIRDPRLSSLISVTEVRTSSDLKYARVYVSVMGNEKEKTQALKALTGASKYFSHELRDYLSMRFVPELSFSLDNSIEHGAYLLELIKQASPESNTDNNMIPEEK